MAESKHNEGSQRDLNNSPDVAVVVAAAVTDTAVTDAAVTAAVTDAANEIVESRSDSERDTILVVDDDKFNLNVLSHILKSQYNVHVAKSGNQALKRVGQDKPDLILLDVLMPDMDGYEVLIALKNSDLTRHIPVIFITGLSNAEAEEKGFFLGAVDYITKPFNNSIVMARVRNQLQIVHQIRTIERLGMIDALTNIPNRRSFDESIEFEWNRAIREQSFLSLLFLDVDFFKKYNDTYGHPQGDVLLQEIVRIVSDTLRRSTDRVFRYGGEEFTVILPNTPVNAAIGIAETIRRNVQRAQIQNLNNAKPTAITVSIGVAGHAPQKDETYTDLLERADSALYKAKRSGRNQVQLFTEGDELTCNLHN
jgi:diguanylate cyclase (GGDEF)-like protein